MCIVCQNNSAPEPGWEPEATDPVESKTPTAASPAPGQILGRNPQETLPVRKENKKSYIACLRT